jgi:hypothetical protein
MAWYNNRYVCPDCGYVWEDDWSACCDDECPECESRHISPVSSEDLTVVVEPTKNGDWSVWRSPPEADDRPRYGLVGVFKAKKSGKLKFVPAKNVDEDRL